MSSLSGVSGAAQHHTQEHSCFPKVLSFVPFVGIIASFIKESSLAEEISRTDDSSRLIDLISEKKVYKIANVFRTLYTAALIITGIAINVLTAGMWLFVAIFLGCTAMHIYRLSHNDRIIQDLAENRARFPLVVL